jgi:four helix bundle protein
VFGVTSQIRRSALSVALNYVEGFARQRTGTNRHFLEIAYGSLKETDYLIRFSHRQEYLSSESEKMLLVLSNRIGAMLWSTIQIKKRIP